MSFCLADVAADEVLFGFDYRATFKCRMMRDRNALTVPFPLFVRSIGGYTFRSDRFIHKISMFPAADYGSFVSPSVGMQAGRPTRIVARVSKYLVVRPASTLGPRCRSSNERGGGGDGFKLDC